MEFFFESNIGPIFTIEVANSDTVLQIKEKIHENQGIPISNQTLLFNGDTLNDELIIHHSQIPARSCIRLLVATTPVATELGGVESTFPLPQPSNETTNEPSSPRIDLDDNPLSMPSSPSGGSKKRSYGSTIPSLAPLATSSAAARSGLGLSPLSVAHGWTSSSPSPVSGGSGLPPVPFTAPSAAAGGLPPPYSASSWNSSEPSPVSGSSEGSGLPTGPFPAPLATSAAAGGLPPPSPASSWTFSSPSPVSGSSVLPPALSASVSPSPDLTNEYSSASTIKLLVKMPDASELDIEFDVNEPMANLKEKIHNMVEDVPVDRLVIVENGADLEDHQTLRECQLTNISEIDVVILQPSTSSGLTRPVPSTAASGSSSDKLRIIVHTQHGAKRYPLEVNFSDTPEDLRRRLQEMKERLELYVPDQFFFVHKQKLMEDDQSFRWHEAKQGDKIEVFAGYVTSGTN